MKEKKTKQESIPVLKVYECINCMTMRQPRIYAPCESCDLNAICEDLSMLLFKYNINLERIENRRDKKSGNKSQTSGLTTDEPDNLRVKIKERKKILNGFLNKITGL